MHEYIPVPLGVSAVELVVDEAGDGGAGHGQRERGHNVTTFKQVWMVAHLPGQYTHIVQE